jgi:hypothetical protein
MKVMGFSQDETSVNIDLKLIKYRLEKKLEWSPEMTDEAIFEYKRFLYLVLKFPKARLVPSKIIDEVWHAHILHTKMYAEHCQEIYGYFLHHRPSLPEESKSKSYEGYRKTLDVYNNTFKKLNDKVWSNISELNAGECDECGSIRCRSQCPTCNQQCNNDQ